jgi:hypothetical protein
VTGGLPDPRELILVPGPYVQDGLDVIDLAELRDTDGRDIVLRVQVDSTVPDLLAMLTKLRGAATVYLGWGVTVEGDALAIGVEPGLRVVERVPVPPVPAEVPGVAPSAPSAPPSDPASVLAAP